MTLLNAIQCSCVLSHWNMSHSLQHHGPSTSVHGILQAGILEWLDIPSSRGSSWPRDQTWVSCIAGGLFIVGPSGNPKRDPEKAPKGAEMYQNSLDFLTFPEDHLPASRVCPLLVLKLPSISLLCCLSLGLHFPKDSRGMPHTELGCVSHFFHWEAPPKGWDCMASSPQSSTIPSPELTHLDWSNGQINVFRQYSYHWNVHFHRGFLEEIWAQRWQTDGRNFMLHEKLPRK